MTLDQMMWSYETHHTDIDVQTALKASLQKLMTGFAKGVTPQTRTRQLFAAAPAPAPFDDNDNTADHFFAAQKLQFEKDLTALLTADSQEGTGAFTKLVLDRAKDYLVNSFCEDFQECITHNGNSAQQAQRPFETLTDSIRRELAEAANDVKNIASQDKQNLARFRHDLARNIIETFRDADPRALGARYFRDVFRWALRKTVAPFSMRGLAEKFAAVSEHAELNNAVFRSAYVDDFNGRMARLSANSAARTQVALWQAEAFLASHRGKPLPPLSIPLRTELDGQYTDFMTEREAANPALLRKRRMVRNKETAIKVLKNVEGEAAVNAMTPERLENQIKRIHASFYKCVHGLYSLSNANMEDLPQADADARVKAWLESAYDAEIAFLEKFCSLKLDATDKSLQKQYFKSTKTKLEPPPLYTALRDAGADFNGLSRDSAVAIGTIMHLSLIPFMKKGSYVEGGQFMAMMNVGGDKQHTLANCLGFLDKLEKEVAKQTGEEKKLLSDRDMEAIKHHYKAPEVEAESRLYKSGCLQVKGFGTLDFLKILNLFKLAGIDLKDFSCDNPEKRAEACMRTLVLMHFAAFNNYNLDALPEYIQRIAGKNVDEVSFSDYLRFRNVPANQRDAVKPGDEKIVNVITGKVRLAEACLSKEDANELRKAFAELRQPNAPSKTIKVMGKTLTLAVLPDGGIRASLKTGDNAGDFKLCRFAQKADVFAHAIDDFIIANAKSFSKEVVLSVLPQVPDPRKGDSLMRSREVYAKTICAFHPEHNPVDFASVPTAALRQLAVDAVNGKPLPALGAAPQTFNSAEMIEMHRNMVSVPLDEVDKKVKLPSGTVRRTEESRRTVPPDTAEFRAIVADLFLNEDTWAFDMQVDALPGERIRKLVLAHSLELKFVFDNIQGFVEHLDQGIRDKVAEILAKLKDIPVETLRPDAQGHIADNIRQQLATVETLVDTLVKTYADLMQTKVTALFGQPHAENAKRPLQYQTFAEISGNASINPNTGEGQLTLSILNGYFSKSARVDQRAMLAAMIRNTDNESSDTKQVAELLKSAGPLLQKLLQGLPISAFNKETQLALKAMKSRLAPIPAEAVKAQLLELVNSSNGEIRSIEVKKVLGAATVGEALLCHVKTKDNPVTGMDCVIKVLRPNIHTAVLREKAIFDEIIATSVPQMAKPFEVRYKGILQEFDLTIEAENVRLGRAHYEHPSVGGKVNLEINSMELAENASPATGTLVLKKVDGVTYDQYIDDIHAEADETISHVEANAVRLNGRVVRPCATVKEYLATRRRLQYLKAFLGEKRNHISDFARVWFENGIYGNGFMHGDLHAGNIMVSEMGATIIDFGNCIRLTKKEQETIRNMVSKASIGYGEDAIKTFRKLLGEDAQKKLDTILANKVKNPHFENFKKDLYGVFKKGTSADVMSRIYAAMNLIQREGVEIPGSITSFFQSYSRLNDIYQTMTDEMARIDAMIDTLVLGEDALPKVGDGALPFVKDFLALVGGISSDPYKESDFAKHASAANKFATMDRMALQDGRKLYYGGKENVGVHGKKMIPEILIVLGNDRKKAMETLVPFFEWLAELEIPKDDIVSLRKGPEHADVSMLDPELRKNLRDEVAKYKNDNPQRDIGFFFTREQEILEFFALQLAGIMDERPRTDSNGPGLGGVKETRDKTIHEVCGEVVSEKLANYSSAMSLVMGFMFDFVGRLDTVALAIRENKRFAEKLETRKEFAIETLDKGNDVLGEELRLTKEKKRILMRQMETFAWPFDGAWAEEHVKGKDDKTLRVKVSLPKEKWETFAEALAVNLTDLKTALGFGVNEKLPPEIARLAVTYLAQIDPRVSLVVKSLDENSYNALIASLGKDQNKEILGAAIDALRKAPGDQELFAANEEAREEFNDIDKAVDKIDPSKIWDLVKDTFGKNNG